MIRLLASQGQVISAPLCAQEPKAAPQQRILDSAGEREVQILSAEGALKVIQVQGPHHGASQLPVPQVPHLLWRPRAGRAGFPGPGCLWRVCYLDTSPWERKADT